MTEKLTAGSSRPVRKVVGKKASQASGLGEDIEMSESEEARGLPAKSEFAKVDAKRAWAQIKKGRVPAGYVLVCR